MDDGEFGMDDGEPGQGDGAESSGVSPVSVRRM